MIQSIQTLRGVRSRRAVCQVLLGASLILATTSAYAASITFDSDRQGWLDAAATWPNAGPVFDAQDLVAARSTTFVVQFITGDNPITDLAHFGQQVCRGDVALCPSPYYRAALSAEEFSTEQWHMLFAQSVLGILFDEPQITWSTTAFSLHPMYADRTSSGLPFFPTSYGFLTDAPLTELSGRQTIFPQSDGHGALCCPSPALAITPIPEPSTALLLVSGAAAGLAWYRRRIRTKPPRS